MPNKPNSINEEAGLGENWVSVDAPPIVPGRNNPAPPPPSGTLFPQTPQYLQGSIPPGYQHDTSFVDTATLTPNAPKFSLMPLGIQGNPTTNAAIQSTASKSSPPSESGKIELRVPDIFTPVDQMVTLPGPLAVDLAKQVQNTVFAGPATAGGIGGGFVESVEGQFVGSDTIILTNTTATPEATVFAFACYQPGVGGSPATGLTATGGLSYFGGSAFGQYDELTAQTMSGASFSTTITFTGGGGTNQSSAGVLVTFNGLVNIVFHNPTYQIATGNAATTTGITTFDIASFSAPVTVGNGMILALYGVGSGDNCYLAGAFTVTDTQGNVWYQIYDTGDPSWGAVNTTRILVFYAPNCAAGTPTIQVTSTHDELACYFRLFEVSAATLYTVEAIPTFRALVEDDLPVVDVAHGGTGLATLPAHAVLLGEATTNVGSAAPGVAGTVLISTGVSTDPEFAVLVVPPPVPPIALVPSGTTFTNISILNGYVFNWASPTADPSVFTVKIVSGTPYAFWIQNSSSTNSITINTTSGSIIGPTSLPPGSTAYIVTDGTDTWILDSGTFYQIWQANGVSVVQRDVANFEAPIQVFDFGGKTTITVPDFGASGIPHSRGLVPDPGASAGTTKYLCENGTWAVPSGSGSGVTSLNMLTGALALAAGAGISITPSGGNTLTIAATGGGAGTAVEINGVGTSSDKQFYFNGVADVVSVWGVQINGASG